MTTRNSLIKSKSTITKKPEISQVQHPWILTPAKKTPTLKNIVMLQDLQTPLKYSCTNHKFY